MVRGWSMVVVVVAACHDPARIAGDAADGPTHPIDAEMVDAPACPKPSVYVAATGVAITRSSYEDAIANRSIVLQSSLTFDPIDPAYATSVVDRAKLALAGYAAVVTDRPVGVVPYNMVVLASSAQFGTQFPPSAQSIAVCGAAINGIAFVRDTSNAVTDGNNIATVAGFMSGLQWINTSTVDCMSLSRVDNATCVFTDHELQFQMYGCPTGATQDEAVAMHEMYTCP